jgi:hypothetical protein
MTSLLTEMTLLAYCTLKQNNFNISTILWFRQSLVTLTNIYQKCPKRNYPKCIYSCKIKFKCAQWIQAKIYRCVLSTPESHKYQQIWFGPSKKFTHKIHHKDNNPVYRKQCKIPEAHLNIIEHLLEEWLKLGIVKCCNSLYNSPILCVPNKQGKGLRVV